MIKTFPHMKIVRKILGLVLISFLAFVYLSAEAAIFWPLLFAPVFFKWDSRIIGAFAILALTACLILLSIEQDVLAEETAVYAYYLLVITVILQIIEFTRSSKYRKEKSRHIPVLDLRKKI